MESPSMMTYIIGAVLVVAVIGGAWYFRSKNASSQVTEPTSGTSVAAVSPTPGPISGLSCDKPYFNPKNGYSEYYLSVEGGDVSAAKTVSCDFTALVNGKTVASVSAESPLTEAPARGGSTFRCTTDSVKLAPSVPTVVNIALRDDLDKTSTCTATFTFPRP